MSDIPRPDSAQRLDSALGHMSTKEMKAARAEVENELESMRVPTEPANDPHLKTTLRASNIEDLKRAAKVASDFMVGMDRVQDVLILLVIKFGRASTMMRGVFIGNFIGVLLLVANLFALWNMSSIQTAIQHKQQKIQDQQGQILERQSSTQKVAGEAKQQAAAAALRADSAPEVSLDAKGRPQLIVKVPDPQGAPGDTTTQVIRLPSPR